MSLVRVTCHVTFVHFYRFQGYCIDLAEKVHEVSQEKYDYVIDLVGDGKYGKADLDEGCWDGMIGELTADYDCVTGEPRKVLNDLYSWLPDICKFDFFIYNFMGEFENVQTICQEPARLSWDPRH